MNRRLVTRLVLLLAVALLPACSEQGDQEAMTTQKVPGADVTVTIQDSPESVGVFTPQTVHVRPGQTVGWINASGDYHTVTFEVPGAPPSSHGFGHGGTFTARFPSLGTYPYRCLYHDGMTGQVIVDRGAATPGRTSRPSG
jgi:plastocyanin